MAESDGVPLRVHWAASAWAQAQAAEQLEAAADQAAVEQGGLRAARAKVAGGVVGLQAVRERTSLYVVAEPPDPTESEVCPFRGLAPFDSAHAEYFFGRERLVADLVARLVDSTVIAVVGPSGSGKSSVIRAGLLPALADGVLPGSERWRQLVMRPGEHPVAELRRALHRTAAGGTGADDEPLGSALDGLQSDERLALAVDQFEEIFTACRDEGERTAFADALVALADDTDRRVVVMLVIRGDFYGRCAAYAELSARISANNVLVGPMRREELRRAIELPAKRAGLRVEPSLVSALVGDVAEEPGGLPLLSTTLVELWEKRGGRTLRRASYEASGGVSGAVARLAERAYLRLTDPQRERARRILLRLVDAEEPEPVRQAGAAFRARGRARPGCGHRARGAHGEPPHHGGRGHRRGRSRGAPARMAKAARLARRGHRGPASPPASDPRRRRVGRLRARSGRALPRGAARLRRWTGPASHDPELNELEREFLDESQSASEREAERQRRVNRRLRSLLAGVGVLLAAAVVAGVIAISERQGARNTATVADAERLGAEALNEERLDDALRLANAGVALDDSVTTRSNLLSTLLRSPAALGVLNVGGEPTSIALSPDGGNARGRRDGRDRAAVRRRDARADRRSPGAGSGLVGRLRSRRRARWRSQGATGRNSSRDTSPSSTPTPRGCAARSRSAAIPPPPTGAAVFRDGRLCPGRAGAWS